MTAIGRTDRVKIKKRARTDTSRTRDLREANEHSRKAQGEDSSAGKSFAGHKPAIDRDR